MAKILLIAGLLLVAWLWFKSKTRRPAMPLAEARSLLGIEAGADAETIRAAHRRIIARVHPDAGGTPELARRTNLARDLLLTELARKPPANR